MLRQALLMVLCTFALAGVVRAQVPSKVTGVGSATISAQPELLRVRLELKGEGKDAKAALAKLDAEQKTAREKFAKAGVPADGITFAEPSLGEHATSEQQRQMQIYLLQRQNSARGGGKAAPTTKPVVVSTLLTAEVPLKSSSAVELLTTASEIQEKLRAAFKPEKKAATPEEQEVLEEMQMQQDMSTGGQPQPGEPTFVFVHRLSEAERAKAVADAFAQAKANAERLARAAGAQLAEVQELSSTPSAGDDDGAAANLQFYGAMVGQRATNGDAASEASGSQAGPVRSGVTVTAVFSLK